LQFILDGCDAQKRNSVLQFIHESSDGLLINVESIIRLFIVFGPLLKKIFCQDLSRDDQGSKSTPGKVFALLIDEGLFLFARDEVLHDGICSLEIEAYF
jgi:hypothetical protein